MKLMTILNEMVSEATVDTGTKTLGGSRLDRDQSMFTIDTAQDVVDTLKSKISAPVVMPKYSTLGGDRNVSVLLSISLDPKDSWSNGIYQNSRYSQFHIFQDGVIEQFGMNYKIPVKFRKTKVKSIDDVVKKINDYISKVI